MRATERSAVPSTLSGHCHVVGLAGGGLWPLASMMTKISYRGYRFPPVIIQQAIWLYARFTLSFRDVEDLLAERARPPGRTPHCHNGTGLRNWPHICALRCNNMA